MSSGGTFVGDIGECEVIVGIGRLLRDDCLAMNCYRLTLLVLSGCPGVLPSRIVQRSRFNVNDAKRFRLSALRKIVAG